MERKTAFISGASRGIGEAIAITLSKEYDVIINYANSEAGAKAVLAKLDPSGKHKMMQCDVANEQDVKEKMCIRDRYYIFFIWERENESVKEKENLKMVR